jgi:hypothetical protein
MNHRRTADLSTALRSGRDDKGKGGYGPQRKVRGGKLQRCDAVGMTKGAAGAWLSFQQLLFTEKRGEALPFVISTGAQRSGEICGSAAPLGNVFRTNYSRTRQAAKKPSPG